MDASEKRRWYCPTPAWLVYALLVVEGLLWLSERYRCVSWHKGYAVLIAVAVVGVATVVMLGWFVVSLVFRWRFQFSIRSLLILTVAVALPCSWLAVEMRAAKRQNEAMASLDKLVLQNAGCLMVRYDYQRGWDDDAEPPGPVWLRRLLADEFFMTPEDVYINAAQITDGELEYISHLGNPKQLAFGGLRIGDSDLERFSKLPQLTGMNFSDGHVTNTGLVHLKGLRELQFVCLNPQITDAGLEHLEGLSKLRILSLDGTQVTDSGMGCLTGLTELRELRLIETKVTGFGLRRLETLPQLTDLYLGKTKVGDAGLGQITLLARLTLLDLSDTQVTDSGLAPLMKLTKLTKLYLDNTKVTTAGVKKLQRALPNCEIVH